MTKVVVKLNCTLIEDSAVGDGSGENVPAPPPVEGEDAAEPYPKTMKTVHLCAVPSDDPQDETGYALGAGPAGKCSLFMTYDAAEMFLVGEDVYVQFSSERPE